MYIWALQSEFSDLKTFVSGSLEEQAMVAAKKSPDCMIEVMELAMDRS
jgi:hypothetical protein